MRREEGSKRGNRKKGVLVIIVGKFLSTSHSKKKEAQPVEFMELPQCSPIKSQRDFPPRWEHKKRRIFKNETSKQKKYGKQALIPDAELFLIKIQMPARC